MILVRFQPIHLAQLDLQPSQHYFLPSMRDPAYARDLQSDWAWTGLHDGTVIGCGGIIEIAPRTGEAWALLSTHLSQHTMQAVRAIKVKLHNYLDHFTRIQTLVDARNIPAIRFAFAVGMLDEGLAHAYGPRGEDYYRFAKWRYP